MKTNMICRDEPCGKSVTERPLYYYRQLITPDDLMLEQEYFRSKQRTHNLMLHGWGVVCGAMVCLVPKAGSNNGKGSRESVTTTISEEKKFEPWQVVVNPGYILGPYGDEINIDCARIVDLRTDGVTGVTGEACVEVSDPWCSEVFEQKNGDHLYIAVRYKEVATRPVRVQPVGCGCDETRCEYSRLRDGYEIAVLDHCPDNHTTPPARNSFDEGPIPQCPPCPDEPWVVLAEVTLGAKGEVLRIDNCSCRRMVVSFSNYWWRCKVITISSWNPKTLTAGETTEFTIGGENLDLVDRINFGKDALLTVNEQTPQKLKGTVIAPPITTTEQRPMNVIAKDPRLNFTVKNAVTIDAGTKAQGDASSGPVETKPVSPGRRTRSRDTPQS